MGVSTLGAQGALAVERTAASDLGLPAAGNRDFLHVSEQSLARRGETHLWAGRGLELPSLPSPPSP